MNRREMLVALAASVGLVTARDKVDAKQSAPPLPDGFVGAVPMGEWDRCGGAVEPEMAYGQRCWAGLDLASQSDIVSLAMVFKAGGGYFVSPVFWCSQASIRANATYTLWQHEGCIKEAGVDMIDYEVIRADILELSRWCQIQQIASDRWSTLTMADQLQKDGLEQIGFGQGFASMAGPTAGMLRLVKDRKITHGGNLVLRQMAANLAIQSDVAGNLKPSRKKSAGNISGMVSLIMALALAMTD